MGGGSQISRGPKSEINQTPTPQSEFLNRPLYMFVLNIWKMFLK